MAKGRINRDVIHPLLGLAPLLAQLPFSKVWSDYDKEADVLYLSFRRPVDARDAEDFIGDGVIVHTDGDAIVGVTILDASTRASIAGRAV